MKKQLPAPLILEKFMLNVCSETCKCVVTVTSTLDRQVRSIYVLKCRRDHDDVMQHLDAVGRQHILMMIARYELSTPIGATSVASTNSEGKQHPNSSKE